MSPEAAVLTQLFAKLLNDYLSEVVGQLEGGWAGARQGLRLSRPYCHPRRGHAYFPITTCHLLRPSLQVTYDADLAGLHYGVRATTAGLLLSVYGYSDTLATLAQVGAAPAAPQTTACHMPARYVPWQQPLGRRSTRCLLPQRVPCGRRFHVF